MYNEGSAEFNALISKAGGNAPITRFKFADFTIERFTKLEYYGGSNNSDDIAIGTTNMAYLDVSAITDKIITNQEFLFEVGMELSDGTIEYAPMGYFTVQKPDGNEDTINFTAYDRMQKFEKPYFSTLTYPTDSAKVLNELCTICGVELATPIINPITITDKLEGYTCREVLGYIAGIHGYFACFDRYGKLNLRWYSETPIEKQIGLIWSLTKSQSNYRVEKITLAKDNETTYTSGTGISGINYSNPYATQDIADSIYTSLGNFTYRPCEISMLDDIRLDPWDMLKVTYLDGSVLTIPVMSLSHSFTDGETKIKSAGKSDTENEYNYSGPVTQAMDRMATELLIANRVIATKVDAEYVQAHAITTDNISAIEAEIKNAVIEDVSAKYADIRLANIDTANIDVANIGLLFTKVGLIDRATIVDGHITGFLDAVEINANNITAGTLIADRILLKGSENGLLYALNNLGELTSTTVDTLDGTILTQRTVTADKLVANSITANELDVTNIFGNSAVLSTLVSQEAFINAISTNKVVVGAYNKSQSIIDNIYSPGTTTIDGSKITTGSITSNKLFVNDLTSLSANIAGFQIKGGNPIYPLLATIKSGSFIQNADGSWTLKGSIGFPQVPYIGDTVVFTFLYQALEEVVNLEITISGSYNGVNLNDKVISLQLLSPTGGDYSVLKKDCGVLQLTDSSGALKTPSLVTITIASDKLLNIEEMHVSGLVSDGRITYNTDSFATDDDSLYISNKGISLGKTFSVTSKGYFETSSGKIADYTIDSEKLSYVDSTTRQGQLVGLYKAFSRISTYNYSKLYLGAGVYDYFYFPCIEQGYIDCNGDTPIEHITFSTNMFGCHADRFSASSVDSDLVPRISSSVPTPSGYNEYTYGLGSPSQPWNDLYVHHIKVSKYTDGDSGNIYAEGDIIAGVGTSNQVSLQTLNSKLPYLENGNYQTFSVIGKKYYGAEQIFVPFINANARNITITKITAMSGNNDIDITKGYSIVKYYTGFRITVSAGDYVGCYASIRFALS